MPISYTRVPFEQLLCHEGAYNLIDIAGHLHFENWNINEFEHGLLGCNGTRYIRTAEDRAALLKPLLVLDRMMPLYRFGEEGQHYAYELFLSKPEHWQLIVCELSGCISPEKRISTISPMLWF